MRLGSVALVLALILGWSLTGAAAEQQRIALEHPLVLADADGQPVTSDDFPGQWLLIYFGYIHCADQCPTAISAMVEALSEIGPAAEHIRCSSRSIPSAIMAPRSGISPPPSTSA